jgi:hypothetical protein
MTEKNYAEMSEAEKKKEDWMNSKWRPMMGWMYMAVCMADFIIFPVLWSMVQAIMHHPQMTQWQPLTLQGAGLFHIAMGAVLGLAAFGRTQEKIAGANNGGMQPVAQSVTTTYGTPSTPYTPPSAPTARPAFTPSYAAPTAAPFISSSGKPGPAPEPEPEL